MHSSFKKSKKKKTKTNTCSKLTTETLETLDAVTDVALASLLLTLNICTPFSCGSIVDLEQVHSTAKLHSTKPELRFFVGSNPVGGMSEVYNSENL